MKGHQKRITGLAFSSNLNVLVSTGADAQVCCTMILLFYSVFIIFTFVVYDFCCLQMGVRSDVSWNNKTKLCRSINVCLCLETWFFFSSNFLLSWICLDILRLVWLSIHSLRHLRFRLFKYFLHLHVLISVRVFIEYFFSYIFSKDLTDMKINFTSGSYAFWYVPPLLLLVLFQWIIFCRFAFGTLNLGRRGNQLQFNYLLEGCLLVTLVCSSTLIKSACWCAMRLS